MLSLSRIAKIFLISSISLFLFSVFVLDATAAEYSWEHLHTFSSRVRDFDSDPFDAEVLYAALGDGLYRSVDGGASWSLLAFGDRNVSTVAVNPQDSSVLYAGVQDEGGWGHTLRRFDGGTWSEIPDVSGQSIKQIYVDRVHPRILYAAVDSRIHRSYDGGNSWAIAESTHYLYDFAVSPSDPMKIYAAAGTCGLCKTDDGGDTWTGCRSSCTPFTSKVTSVATDSFGDNPVIYTLTGGGPTFSSCLYPWVGEGPADALHHSCMAEDAAFNPYVRDEIFLTGGNQSGRRFVKRSEDFGENWISFEEGLLPSSYPGPYVSDFYTHNAVPYLYALSGFYDLYWAQVGEITITDKPVILVPGMGASFNPSMFFGHGPDNWAWSPGVQVYDGLLESFENAGYVADKTLFTAFYDWRAPMLESSCEYLKPVIEEALALSGAEKVWLVGHSQGGLLGRAYVQGDCYGGDVEKLVTLGTPHMGTADAYYAWEGGEFKGYEGLISLPMNISITFLQIQQKTSRVQVVRNLLPSFKEILPIYDFLEQDGALKAWNSLVEVNPFLPSLNDGLSGLIGSTDLTTISGDGNDTSEFIKVTQRSEAVGDKWIDGQPVELNPIEFGDGDGRILKSSSLVDGASQQLAEGLNHGELVGLADGQKKLFASLGITMEDSKFVESPPFDAILGFFLGSPATLLVTDSEGNKVGYDPDTGNYVNDLGADIWGHDQEEKWIVIPNPGANEYVARVFPLGDGGVYHLFASYESDQSQGQEETVGEVLGDEEPDEVVFVLSPGNIEEPIKINDSIGEIALEEITSQSTEFKTLIKGWDLPNSVRKLILKSIKNIEKYAKRVQKYLGKGDSRKAEAYLKFAMTKLNAFEDIANNFYSRGLLTEEQMDIINFYLEGLKESVLSFRT